MTVIFSNKESKQKDSVNIIQYFALVRGGLTLSSGMYWKVHEQRKRQSNKEIKQKTQIIKRKPASSGFFWLNRSLAMPYFPMGEPQSIIGAE
jgi:hypothetical protein